MKKYAIDTCALIDAAKHYNMKIKRFDFVWTTFNEMIEKGSLVSSIEVLDEIKDDDLLEWSNQHDTLFVPLTDRIQQETANILKDYPTLIKLKSTANSNADPFLIATAKVEDAIIVSNEKLGDEKTNDYHIPNVCKKYNIPCITLDELFFELFEE